MAIKDILLFVLPIITGIGSSYLTYYLTFKSKKNEAIFKFKEEKYANLLILLQGFVGNTASADKKRKFLEEQYKSWLYSSDEVISAINNMINIVIKTQVNKTVSEEYKNATGEIVLAMRRDMLHKTNLKPSDFKYMDVLEDKHPPL